MHYNCYARGINHLSTSSVSKGQDHCQFTFVALRLLVLPSTELMFNVGDGKIQSEPTNITGHPEPVREGAAESWLRTRSPGSQFWLPMYVLTPMGAR